MTDKPLTWVQRAALEMLHSKAQAIWDIDDYATSRYDVTDGRVLQMILLEVINQCQDGQGNISAAELHRIAEYLGKEMQA